MSLIDQTQDGTILPANWTNGGGVKCDGHVGVSIVVPVRVRLAGKGAGKALRPVQSQHGTS